MDLDCFILVMLFCVCPQNVCPRWCKFALLAFEWLFYTVCFQMSPEIPCLMLSHTECICSVDSFVLCIFKCVFESPACKDAKLHWLHLFNFFHLMSLNMSSKHLHASMQFAHWLHVHNFYPLCVFRCVSIFRTYPVRRSVRSDGDDNGHGQISTVSDLSSELSRARLMWP